MWIDRMSFQKESKEKCVCPLGEVMDVISKKWALLIINTIGNNEKLRYNKIMEGLKGINSKTLSDRLKELEEYGLIKREAYAEIPPRVEYTLTNDGVELARAMLPLMQWANSHNLLKKETKTPCDVAYRKIAKL
ncbi:transcriptional regulator [Candidatus Bathyarchaeota archaeon]|nr:MAG: transcriptional regulator [Candidatus Bathyarchaeota archaeon]